MKFCPECGTKIISQRFCHECGCKISDGEGSANTQPQSFNENTSSQYNDFNGSFSFGEIKTDNSSSFGGFDFSSLNTETSCSDQKFIFAKIGKKSKSQDHFSRNIFK